jgi:hypothetical protein
MEVIREQRENVIINNNTAQETLARLLERVTSSAERIHIKEALHGDIDFSILRTSGLTSVQYITLSKGEITNITGLPENLLGFYCPDNLLIELENLPTTLKSITIPHNFLTRINVSRLKQLEVLNIIDNKLTKLENLPTTLNTLYCENNKLTELNLEGVTELTTLYVSNNPITVIENFPEKVSDFVMENTPSIEFRNSPKLSLTSIKSSPDADATLLDRDYIQSLNEYFRIKSKYQAAERKLKAKIYDKHVNKRAAKREILSIKPPCVKCKRAVGTIFSRKKYRYAATCGDAQNPCPLRIELYVGTIMPIEYMVYLIKEDVDTMKETIIRQKLDTLFNYINEEKSVELFKKEMESYTSNSMTYKELLDKQNALFYDEHKRELIEKKMGVMFETIESNRVLLDEYLKTGNKEVLKTAVDIQIKELIPESRNLRMLKYEVMELLSEENSKKVMEHTLFQYPVSVHKIDYVFGEPPRVIKFTI